MGSSLFRWRPIYGALKNLVFSLKNNNFEEKRLVFVCFKIETQKERILFWV